MNRQTNNNRRKINRLRRRIVRNNRRRRRIDRNQNRRINNLQRQLANLKITTQQNIGKQGTELLVPYQQTYDFDAYKHEINEYIKAILYPEDYLSVGIKLPSPINTYSFTYGFKEQFDFSPSASGVFNLIWFPNLFSCSSIKVGSSYIEGTTRLKVGTSMFYYSGVKRFLVANNDANLTEWWVPATHVMYNGCEGYRLVSASIQIRYIGNQINKAGYIMSIPSYREMPAFATENADLSTTFRTNLIPIIDESVFVNTRGTKSNFTLSPDNIVKRVYIPIDPADQVFEDPGFYYSSAVSSNQSYQEFQNAAEAVSKGVLTPSVDNVYHLRVLKPEDGNPLKYIFLGKGFMDVQGSIHVEAFYNFECIPMEGMRNTSNPTSLTGVEISDSDKKTILQESAKEEMSSNPNVFSKGKKAAQRVFNRFMSRFTYARKNNQVGFYRPLKRQGVPGKRGRQRKTEL